MSCMAVCHAPWLTSAPALMPFPTLLCSRLVVIVAVCSFEKLSFQRFKALDALMDVLLDSASSGSRVLRKVCTTLSTDLAHVTKSMTSSGEIVHSKTLCCTGLCAMPLVAVRMRWGAIFLRSLANQTFENKAHAGLRHLRTRFKLQNRADISLKCLSEPYAATTVAFKRRERRGQVSTGLFGAQSPCNVQRSCITVLACQSRNVLRKEYANAASHAEE